MKLFVFGSTGDLVRRKIIPAFAELQENIEIIALGRRDLNDKSYEEFIGKNSFNKLKIKPKYYKTDFNNLANGSFNQLLNKKEESFFYIALPPEDIEKIIPYLVELKLKNFKIKILIEKPFGKNLENAKYLKKISRKIIKDIFISDHYLFKKEVEKIQAQAFNKIKIVSLEKLGLEKRATYYDEVGALKDMVQSHFLNIVFNLVKNPRKELANFKILNYTRAQYGNGKNTGYVKELGKPSKTETFVNVKLKTQNKEFVFVTGKKFNKKLSFIEIDNKKIEIKSDKNPYTNLFSNFFSKNKEKFPTIDDSILAWEIIEKIQAKQTKLNYYKENTSAEIMINNLQKLSYN